MKWKTYRDLFKLGLPIMVGQLGIIFLSFADTMMIGHYGTMELGAAGFVNNIFNLVIIFSTGFSYGLTPVVGGNFGRGDLNGAGRDLKNSIVLNIILSFVLIGIMYIFYLNIHLMGQPQELLHLIRPYYAVLLISIPFILIFSTFKQFLEGVTDSVTPMVFLLAGNCINVFLNWVLIYGNVGFPEMGLIGAGVATLVSRVLMAVALIVVFMTKKYYAPFREGFNSSAADIPSMRTLFKTGMPVGLQMGMETASFNLSTIMVGWLGTVALASHQVMLTVGQLGYMLYYGMAAAVAVLASNCCGRGEYHQMQRYVNAGFRIIMVMALCASLTLVLLKDYIGDFFSESQEVGVMVASLVLPFVLYQFGDGLQCNYSNALRGINDVKRVPLYAFIAYFVISLPSAYIFGFVCRWGLVGIWFSFPLGLTSAGIMFYLRYRKGWSRITLPNGLPERQAE